jgi:hypothetical protein
MMGLLRLAGSRCPESSERYHEVALEDSTPNSTFG